MTGFSLRNGADAVTGEQIEPFGNTHPPDRLPFAEVWMTGSPAGTSHTNQAADSVMRVALFAQPSGGRYFVPAPRRRSRKCVSNFPATNCGSAKMRLCSGIVVLIP